MESPPIFRLLRPARLLRSAGARNSSWRCSRKSVQADCLKYAPSLL